MASFADSFEDDSVPHTESARSFADDDTYVTYNSQQFDTFYGGSDAVLEAQQPPIYAAGSEFAAEDDGKGFDGDLGGSDGPILPPPLEMAAEEGLALREWRRQNAIRLEEKEEIEKELLRKIIEEADEYKVEFHRKREIACENNKATNREKEKVLLTNQEKFHAEADKNYWKSIAELIPNEVLAIDKKREKKDKDSKAAITVIQGPKPGKPAELSRMRQILLKLKHSTPSHLRLSPPPAPGRAKDMNSGNAAVTATSVKAAVVTPEVVAVA